MLRIPRIQLDIASSDLKKREEEAGFNRLEHYLTFAEKVAETKRKFLAFLIEAKGEGKTIVGYGAPAKGNTLLKLLRGSNGFRRLHS